MTDDDPRVIDLMLAIVRALMPALTRDEAMRSYEEELAKLQKATEEEDGE